MLLKIPNFKTLNQYIRAERSNKFMSSKIKKSCTDTVVWQVKNWKRITKPVKITFTWYWKDTRTDPDNIAFMQKFILDGLVKAKVLQNDGWRNIIELHHKFEIGDMCVNVEMEEV